MTDRSKVERKEAGDGRSGPMTKDALQKLKDAYSTH